MDPIFDKWLQMGIDNGWISEGVCATHDILPMTEEEEHDFDDGGDPCIPAVRVYIP